MIAIQTRYLGPTNHRGARIKAWTDSRSITVHWNHRLSSSDNHQAAAQQLLDRMDYGESFALTSGTLPDGNGCHVLTMKEEA
jgi:hypothetical protein